MSDRIEDALELEPGTYQDGDAEYAVLESLTSEDYTEYLDILAQDGRTCTYNTHEDSYVIS